MVAPLSLPKPSYNLVKVPKIDSSQNRLRLRAIRAGGKLSPRHRNDDTITTSARTPPTENNPVSDRIPSPGPSSSDSTEGQLIVENLPFRSQRKRNLSETTITSDAPSVSTKVKAYELEPLSDPTLERCRKNALNAKINREAKKKHLAELERRVENVSRERDTLAEENENLRDAKIKLEQQVKHLNNILKNQSKLATLLGKIDQSKVSIDLSAQSENEVISSVSGR
ncbi:unnamed protein product [Meganyctiphanes norvegica]|uniref:BZIP domain-containing protein n=1 Tax=Meganyctiphanes norvegica TaxID=48144 RepID=A0AAV2QCU6_MEGNR